MINLFWPVYLNLENELLSLANVIHIDDKQLDVYSMKISDLLVRTVVEIESISKELYLQNGGTIPEEGFLYFDTDCIKLLEDKWLLSKKKVIVSSPMLYFQEEADKVLTPLHNAYKRGTSAADWERAYQAVKHDRANQLNKGNIKHFIRALAALYVLNLYYKDSEIKNIKDVDMSGLNLNFGSAVFSVSMYQLNGISAEGVCHGRGTSDEHIFVQEYTAETVERVQEGMRSVKNYINENTKEELRVKAELRIKEGLPVDVDWVREEREKIAQEKKLFPIRDRDVIQKMSNMGNLVSNIVLNKGQYAHPES